MQREMAPSPLHFLRSVNTADPVTAPDYFAAQWINPGDIFDVLLLLGPEVVQQAVAQLAGRAVTPVAFSFGWVAYSVKALLAVVGGEYQTDRYTTSLGGLGARGRRRRLI